MLLLKHRVPVFPQKHATTVFQCSIKTCARARVCVFPTYVMNEFTINSHCHDIFVWKLMLLPYVTNGFATDPVFMVFFVSKNFSPYLSNWFTIDHDSLPFAVFCRHSQTKSNHHDWRPFVTSVTNPPLKYSWRQILCDVTHKPANIAVLETWVWWRLLSG
jgi:hypothetical protein